MPEGLGTPDLECVMIDIAPLDVLNILHPTAENELFFGTTPELKYAQGAVGATKPHVTLLFGIHPSASYHRWVWAVLKDWTPEPIKITEVGVFPVRDEDQEYRVVIGHVEKTPNLLEARARLETLDYTDGFPEYKPHVTLAYIKRDADEHRWIQRLGEEYNGKVFPVTGVNLGDD
jgi:2''-5'' RNA ligase